MKADEIKAGMQVRYIPHHAQNNPNHPDCETGIVISVTPKVALVRYFRNGLLQSTAQSTEFQDLIKWGDAI